MLSLLHQRMARNGSVGATIVFGRLRAHTSHKRIAGASAPDLGHSFSWFLGFDWRIQINNLSHFFLHTLCLWSAALGLKRISATCRYIKANGLTVFSIEEQALLVGMA